ncbi:MAG: hypothetical protein ACI85O_000178 [Saprospiraceae bacterium]|jgi:hypothetical protein
MNNLYTMLSRNGSTIAFGLGSAVVAIFLISVFSQIGDKTTVEQLSATNIFDLGLYLTIFLTVLCALAIVGFGIFHVVTDLKGALKGLIGVGILAVIFGIAYATATPEVAGDPIFETMGKFKITPGISKFVSGAIIATMATLLIAVLSLVGSAVYNLIK